jgi:galactokinase
MLDSPVLPDIKTKFRQVYNREARVFRAPGRVNLIGEHTDYNDGFVMPAAIDFAVWIAIAPRADRKLIVHSIDFSQTIEIDLDDSPQAAQKHWSDYIRGVTLMLEKAGYHLRGGDLLVHGDVPIGSGLSSSAAVEVATAFALLGNSGLEMDRVQIAKLCQRSENEFVGVRVGIMDQFISCCGRLDHALMLDCRSLDFRLLPVPSAVSLVICNTMVKHELGSGEYNVRRAQCEEGVRILSGTIPNIRALRDVTEQQLEEHRSEFPDLVYRRCHHVVTENARVEQAAAALESENLSQFGRLMADSHRSLRDDYQVSCRELDLMVELAAKQPGVYGSRMTGGGFGGCTISLVRNDAVPHFQETVSDAYRELTGLTPQIFVSSAADGAGEVLA